MRMDCPPNEVNGRVTEEAGKQTQGTILKLVVIEEMTISPNNWGAHKKGKKNTPVTTKNCNKNTVLVWKKKKDQEDLSTPSSHHKTDLAISF